MTVSTSGTLPDNLPTVTDCVYGDTVQIDREGGASFVIAEIAVVNMKGYDEKRQRAPLCYVSKKLYLIHDPIKFYQPKSTF